MPYDFDFTGKLRPGPAAPWYSAAQRHFKTAQGRSPSLKRSFAAATVGSTVPYDFDFTSKLRLDSATVFSRAAAFQDSLGRSPRNGSAPKPSAEGALQRESWLPLKARDKNIIL